MRVLVVWKRPVGALLWSRLKAGCTKLFSPGWRQLPTGSGPGTALAVFGELCIGRRAQIGDDYALIAARRGWTPMMFMTRVRL